MATLIIFGGYAFARRNIWLVRINERIHRRKIEIAFRLNTYMQKITKNLLRFVERNEF